MKKICLVTLALAAGGAERFVSELANYWASQGHEVHLVLLFKKPHFYTLDEKIKVYEPDFSRATMGKLAYFHHLWGYLRQTVQQIAPDTVLNVGYNSLVAFCLKGLPYPVFISNRSNPEKPRPFWYKLIRRWIYGGVNGMLAQTSLAKRYFTRHTGQQNIAVIPNFVRPIADTEPQPEQAIVSVGRFIRSKNFGALLRIFAQINPSDWKLILVGDGYQRAALEQQAQDLGIADRVEFVGMQKNVDVYLQRAAIFAFPSLSEGFPNALLEAMATPLACVSYDCPAGPADLIEHGVNGFIVPLNDEVLFQQYLETLMRDQELRARIRAQAVQVREKHSLATLSEQILRFITP